jgi:5-methylcytosine-specific restriction endonuclease McrA
MPAATSAELSAEVSAELEARRRASEELHSRLEAVLPTLTNARSVFGLSTPPVPNNLKAMEQLLAGLDGLAHFECQRCGRYASVFEAEAALSEAVERTLGGSHNWSLLRTHALRGDLRPATMQRYEGMTYEAAVALLKRGESLGLLRRANGAYALRGGVCPECLSAASAGVEKESPERAAARESIPPQLRFRVLQRDGFRCQYCGRSARDGATLHLDHVVPVVAGGETSEDNLITACEQCNLGKSASEVV